MQVGILEQKKKRGIYIYSSYRYDTVNQLKTKKEHHLPLKLYSSMFWLSPNSWWVEANVI